MIHRDDGIELSLQRVVKNYVARQRADNVESFFLRGGNGWRNDFNLLVAKFPAFACVRVQSSDDDFSARQAKVAAGLRGEFDGEYDFCGRDFFWNGLER